MTKYQHAPYTEMAIGPDDFADFKKGFEDFQPLRTAMQLAMRDAQEVMHGILNDIEIKSTAKKPKDIKEFISMQDRGIPIDRL